MGNSSKLHTSQYDPNFSTRQKKENGEAGKVLFYFTHPDNYSMFYYWIKIGNYS